MVLVWWCVGISEGIRMGNGSWNGLVLYIVTRKMRVPIVEICWILYDIIL